MTRLAAGAQIPHGHPRQLGFHRLPVVGEDRTVYDAQAIEQMSYKLTMLAYDMNNETLSFGHGAPLHLREETRFGFKLVKWIKGIEFFGYRESI